MMRRAQQQSRHSHATSRQRTAERAEHRRETYSLRVSAISAVSFRSSSSTSVNASSKILIAVSASARVSTSGGEKRIAFLPAPSTSRPRVERGGDDGVALVDRALLGLAIAHQLDADHQAAAAHVADQRMLVGERCQPGHQVRADIGRIGDQLVLAAARSSPAPPRTTPGCRRTCWRARRAATPSGRRAPRRRRAAARRRCPWRSPSRPARRR